MPDPTGDRLSFDRITADGRAERIDRLLADETPIAIEFNGIGYAVLMASAIDLEDLAYGFARAERLIEAPAHILDTDVHHTPDGVILRVTLDQSRVDRVLDRVRHRVSESSCGLCGIENLEQALRPLPRLEVAPAILPAAIFKALGDLRAAQPINAATGAVHAAALCSAAGEIRLSREDVGRHNAFDKLLGAMFRQGLHWDGGFALLTSRCSYEIVEKAALAHCPMLVTISAPTNLAVRRAQAAGLALVVLARPDAILKVSP